MLAMRLTLKHQNPPSHCLYINTIFICSIYVSSCFLTVTSQRAPALYIFGDSTVDGGNTEPTPPYGLDLHYPVAPRATNGLTWADLMTLLLDLPLVPPYNNSVLASSSLTGVNYAFSGSGILPQSSPNTRNFDLQIAEFRSTLENNLNKAFFKPGELSDHLSRSLFLISFGINDFSHAYLADPTLDPQVFADSLLDALSVRLTTLYRMGGRKFLVNNIWPMGCLPSYHYGNYTCNPYFNKHVIPYANSLPGMLQKLASSLPGLRYSFTKDFEFVEHLNVHAKDYGISNITGACYIKEVKWLCPNRDTYIYFDVVHTTEVVNKLFALSCFNGTLCSPDNVVQLLGA